MTTTPKRIPKGTRVRPAAKAMGVAFRAFAARLLALNARASEALGKVEVEG